MKPLFTAADVALSVGVLLGSAPASGAISPGFRSHTIFFDENTPWEPVEVFIPFIGGGSTFNLPHDTAGGSLFSNGFSYGSYEEGSDEPRGSGHKLSFIVFDEEYDYYYPYDPDISDFSINGFYGGSGTITYGNGKYDGHDAFGVNWIDIAPPEWSKLSGLNSYQLLLVDRSGDTGRSDGDFDVIFNYDYDTLQWSSDHYYLPQLFEVCWDMACSVTVSSPFSGGYDCSSDSFRSCFHYVNNVGSNLPNKSFNSNARGRYVFEVRNNPIPEPKTWAMLLAGLGIVGAVAKRRRQG
ncbi:MAG: PEPxxWA-CTERM sorting domain-containing protein [Azoarcus sp.]|jgi:hypothetical protein|nr:PEPxxWA-CTERM sorting domain-containing protein [Azoarcus sp.]